MRVCNWDSNASTQPELAPTQSTPEGKPKRPPKSHPSIYLLKIVSNPLPKQYRKPHHVLNASRNKDVLILASGSLKISDIRLPRVSKAIQKATLKTWCFKGRHRTTIFGKIKEISMILGARNRPEIDQKNWKFNVKKQHVVGYDFPLNFHRFGFWKWIERQAFFIPLYKMLL